MNEIYGVKNNKKLNDDYLLKKRNAIESNIDYSHGQSNRKDLAKYKLLKGPNGSQTESANESTREGKFLFRFQKNFRTFFNHKKALTLAF